MLHPSSWARGAGRLWWVATLLGALSFGGSGVAGAATVLEAEPNDGILQAQAIAPASFTLDANPAIGNAVADTSTRLPHASIIGGGNATVDVYSFTVTQSGVRVIADIDGGDDGTAFSAAPNLGAVDTLVRLYDAAGNLIAASDDTGVSNGAGGSIGFFGGSLSLDPFLIHTLRAAGTYFVEVSQSGGCPAGTDASCVPGPIALGGTYTLHLSLGPPHHSDDFIAGFGAAGLWARLDDSTWNKVHGLSPQVLAACDMDDNGQDELIVGFGSSAGLWLRRNNAGWEKLHGLTPQRITTADVDSNGQCDLILDFGSSGLWLYRNDSTWQRLHSLSAAHAGACSFDGGGNDAPVIDFGASIGIWKYAPRNGSTWQRIHSLSSEGFVSADIDGNDRCDLVIDFGAPGVWIYRNGSGWSKLHGLSPTVMAACDIDGNGRDDVVLGFGSGIGLWAYMNDDHWIKVHALAPRAIVTGDLDRNGQCDLTIDFGPLGTWEYRNGTTWRKAHSLAPAVMATGNINGN